MRLTAIESTEDGRLTAGKVYEGQFVLLPTSQYEHSIMGLRFVCWDNKGEWMTFNPKAFVPLGEWSRRIYG